ncbi:MAG TPA: adenylyltransferase/cytidyltransferase family protein [Candidatus Absconditabacterales bacterium]|nr:adenylyltransferase/cytidyltransferase family protein [Candidatus Absconditabacterales bacterium]HNG97370.1 adenylyltransferase/cytidyltransferase family protein [Candidatus Absconditabacterales bacterium]
MKTIVVTSGYFNPLHPGHIECFELSKMLGDELWVIVNNDHQAMLKRGVPSFQDEQLRMRVVGALKSVDKAILSIDTDHSVCKSLDMVFTQIKELYHGYVHIVFTKGGDRFTKNIPEVQVCHDHGVTIIDGLGLKTHHSRDFV